MMVFYQEQTGDFLAVDTSTNGYYLETFGKDHFEGRAAAIEGVVGSVCTTGIARDHLRKRCRRVAKADVMPGWRKAIGM